MSFGMLVFGPFVIFALCKLLFESDSVRAKREEQNKRKELRSLAKRISAYGHSVIVVGTLRLIGSNSNNAFSAVASSLQ
jgi:hypothetical protein